MDPPYMEDFLNHDFAVRCIKDRYCFRCQLAYCFHCCPNHQVHHQQHTRNHIARIRLIAGRRVINAMDSMGVGYEWRRIQWFRFHGDRWMHLQQPHDPFPYPGYPHNCIHCNEKRKSKFDFCAITCQVQHEPVANGIGQATNLLAVNWEQIDYDSYCTRCHKSFPSAYCDAHVVLHHPNQAAATIRVYHHAGWALVTPDQQVIPPSFFEGVQLVEVDGVGMHPIRSRPLQQQVPPIANLMHPCAVPCVEGIPLEAQFCSIHCRRLAVAA